MANNPNIDTVVLSKPGLVTDLNSSYISKEQYSYARNAVRNSKDGDLGTIGNEPSNIECFSAPYPIVGHTTLPDGNILLFSGDRNGSEIGEGNPLDCSYKTLVNADCLSFSVHHPISAVAKKDFQKGVIVTFTDRNNPVRRIELKKLSGLADCDEILLFKKLTQPCITVKKGTTGNIPNGTYSVAVAYSIDGNIFSDWMSITNRIMLYSETNSNSIDVTISGLDQEFEHFVVALVGNYIDPNTKGATKLAKQIGQFSTKIKTFSITDFLNDDYPAIQLSQLVIKKRAWAKAGIISSNSNYLILADLVGSPEENYQRKAMEIEVEYVVDQVEAEYYENDGADVGYYRDENYDFYINGVRTTGERTDKFHIGGKKATEADMAIVASADVFEYDTQFKDCTDIGKVLAWQVENTAGKMVPYNAEFYCGRRTLGYGKMGYHQSTEFYSSNRNTYGEDAGTPVRFHKMPDECKVPRYSTINGKTYINILGVRFKNIAKFDSPDIVGYEITRSDRKGGNGTVVARGLMSNVRYYVDKQLDQEVMFSNYPVNDLSPDAFLSSTQTVFKNGKEHEFTPLTDYYTDKFNFYSPHTLFEPRYSLGTELKIESQEIADVKGKFELVYNHPKQKLMNQFAFWISAAVGFIESSLVLLGKTDISALSGVKIGVDGGPYWEIQNNLKIDSVKDLVELPPGTIIDMVASAIKAADPTKFGTILNLLKVVIQSIASLALKVPYSILSGIIEADRTLQTIYDFTGYTNYVYQYNAVAKFNKSICQKSGNKRRRLLTDPKYIPSDVVSIDDKIYNNYFREKTVLLELNKPIANPVTTDTTRNTMSGFGICDDPTKSSTSVGSMFYATSKVINPNQYGRVGSANPVSMHSCVLSFTEEEFAETPTLYGGDCIIARFQFLKKMQFFNQNLATVNEGTGQPYPDGTEYDYRLYRNIAYPRFWMDSSKYDFSQLLSKNVVNFSRFNRTTASKHNLDCKKSNDGESITRIDNAYMYLSNNAALDFFVEADYNIHFREKTDKPFYSKRNTNLTQIFRSDRLDEPEEFNISRVYSDIYTTEIFAIQQREDYNPSDPIPTEQPNSVIYSLPSFNLQQVDNWQYFLPANYFAFKESDFGKLTAIHKMDQDRIIFLFSKSSPYISMGRDILELDGSGRKVTLGDGGLFAQDPREIMPTDNDYGACNSKYAFSNTHLGRFYPSERQGRILNVGNGLDDITREGMAYWCKNYMPIALYDFFPTYPREENPLSGVGYLAAFDSFNETIYITKRDFSPKTTGITYDKGFKFKGKSISLRDPNYFEDISWTLSYSPADKGFISYHDWHPDWIIQTDNHFMTVKGNTVWKHNESYDSYCKFYNVQYPFEIEYISSAGQSVDIIRSLEYILEVYTYKNFGRDRFNVLNENFDRLIVRNIEQISPLLNLFHANPNPEENLEYPKKSPADAVSFDIPFFKEENKYRVNMFWDTTKDRGEFSGKQMHLFPTDGSGYKSVINPVAIDLHKPEEERKKFRHYTNKFRLIKTNSGDKKFITKLLNVKKNSSIR